MEGGGGGGGGGVVVSGGTLDRFSTGVPIGNVTTAEPDIVRMQGARLSHCERGEDRLSEDVTGLFLRRKKSAPARQRRPFQSACRWW